MSPWVPYPAKTSDVKDQLSSEMASFSKDDITTAIPMPLAGTLTAAEITARVRTDIQTNFCCCQ